MSTASSAQETDEVESNPQNSSPSRGNQISASTHRRPDASTFSHFNKLPNELRHSVWNFALKSLTFAWLDLLEVNHEARETALTKVWVLKETNDYDSFTSRAQRHAESHISPPSVIVLIKPSLAALSLDLLRQTTQTIGTSFNAESFAPKTTLVIDQDICHVFSFDAAQRSKWRSDWSHEAAVAVSEAKCTIIKFLPITPCQRNFLPGSSYNVGPRRKKWPK